MQRRMLIWLRSVGVVIAIAALGGCSAAGLLYGQAHWLVADYLTNLADLEPTQSEAMSQRMKGVHAWHRRTELPAYAALIDSALVALDHGLTREEALTIYNRGFAHYRGLMGQIGAGFAPIYAQLRPDQIVTLEDNLNEANGDLQDRYASNGLESRKAKRRERVVERVEQVVGDLRSEQVALIESNSDALPDSGPLWFEYRVVQQIRFLGMLKERRDADALVRHLHAWLAEGAGRGERLTAYTAQLETRVADLIVAVVGSLDQQQRVDLRSQLREYRDLALELAEAS